MGRCQRRSLAYLLLLLVCSLLIPSLGTAQGHCPYRMREHTTDCTVLTDGQDCDLCYEHDSSRLWKCVPTVVGESCSGAEWKEIKFVVTDADVPNTITVTLAATATALATNPAPCPPTQYVTDMEATGTLVCSTPPGGTDANAIHGTISGEIAAIADKATPVGADHLLIEDSAASDAKKDITISSLTSVFATDTELSTHNSATNVHGVANTTLLITGSSPTITTPNLTLEDGTAAAPTTDGRLKYNRTTERLQVGDGAATQEFVAVGTLTTAKFCTYDAAGLEIDCTSDAISGSSPTITTPNLTLEDGTGAPPTTDGRIKYNRTTERLQVGDGTDTMEFVPVGTLTDTKLCTWDATSGVMQCATDPASGLGDVVGPAASTLNAVPRYSSTTGKALKDSAVTVSDTGIITAAGYETAAVSTSGGLLRLCEDGDLDPENDCVVLRVPDGRNLPDGETIHDVDVNGKFPNTLIANLPAFDSADPGATNLFPKWDDTENEVDWESAATHRTALDVSQTGHHLLVTKSTATSYTIGTTDSREMFGGVIYVTGAATITVPAVAAGQSFTVITIGAVAVSVDPNAADRIILDGTALADGDKVTNTSTTGDMLVCTYESANGFYCASGSNDGDPWTDTN